jgi:hypothetical protein
MHAQQDNPHQGAHPRAEGKFFGIPLGDFGFFTSLLMALGVGFLSFFLFTFLAIVGLMIYNGMGHQVDLADSYKYISFPAACVVLVASLIFFGTLWLRRKVSGG